MAIKTVHNTFDKTWFITFTCFKWIPLFEIPNSYDLVYNWHNLVKLKGQADTLAFVIMPKSIESLNLHLMLKQFSPNSFYIKNLIISIIIL